MNIPDWSTVLTQSFGWMLRASWQAAILVVAVLIIQRLLRKKLSAGWRFGLWLLVVARLLLPISAESSLSVFNLVAQQPVTLPEPQPKAAEPAPMMPPKEAAPAPPASTVRTLDAQPKAASPSTAPQKSVAATVDPEPSRQAATMAPIEPAAPVRRTVSGWEIAAWIWLIGMLALATHVAVLMMRMAKKVRQAGQVKDDATLQLFETCRRQMRVRARVSLLETEIVNSPALFGVIRPSLLLPIGMAQTFSQDELRYVFLHELAHVKRRDVSLNWLFTALQIVHWFNPVIWFCFARMRVDRELACDALAISSAGETEAKAYGRTIIKLLETLSQSTSQPGLVGIMEDKGQMEQRISMIARFKKQRRLSLLALGFMIVLAATGLTDAVKSAKAKPEAPEKKEEPGETITVTVVDAETGKPVNGGRAIAHFSNNIRFVGEPPSKPIDEVGRVSLLRKDASQIGFAIIHPQYAPVAVTWNWMSSSERTTRPEAPREYTVRLDRGTEIGGTVLDENGKPVANVRVEIKGSTLPRRDTEETSGLEYPIYETRLGECPVTDANGRWSLAHFPRQIEALQISCIRPDQSLVRFQTEKPSWFASTGGVEVKKAALYAKDAVFTLTPGISVRGIVVDAVGKPLAGITLNESDARERSKPLATIVTGNDGRFELPNRDPHQILIKATGAGYALNPKVVNIEPGMPEVQISMTPAVPLRVRFVDEFGKPLPKTVMIPTLKVGWTGTADEDGRVVWNESPTERLSYEIHAENHGSIGRTLAPNQEEQTIKIRKGEKPSTQITIRAQNEEKQPLKAFTVSVASGRRPDGDTEPLGKGTNGLFQGELPIANGGFEGLWFKVDAPGLESFVTKTITAKSGVDLAVTLRKGIGPAQGLVSLPNGTPAAGAKLLIPETGDSPMITLLDAGPNNAPRSDSPDVKSVRADQSGHYSLPEAGSDHAVVVIHTEGFAEMMRSDLSRSPEIHLQPWARLEGTYLLNSQPKENTRMMIHPKARQGYFLWILGTGETDRNGHFQIGKLPPGEYTLYASRTSKARSGVSPQNHGYPVKLTAGETLKVSYACTGRTITGRIRLSTPGVDVDWEKDLEPRMLTARRKGSPREFPIFEDYVRNEDYGQAIELRRTQAPPRLETYAAEIESDGSFRIEGVSPGDYDLAFGITKPEPNRDQQAQSIGTVKREVNVPAANDDQPLDIGVVELELAVDSSHIPKKATAALVAKTQNGQSFDLAQHRGKLVVLTFWVPWAKPTAAELADWKAVSDAYAKDSRVTFASVGLGASEPPPELSGWVQAHLEGRELASATEAWGVDSLPMTFVVSPEGWIAGQALKPSVARALIQQTLNATK